MVKVGGCECFLHCGPGHWLFPAMKVWCGHPWTQPRALTESVRPRGGKGTTQTHPASGENWPKSVPQWKASFLIARLGARGAGTQETEMPDCVHLIKNMWGLASGGLFGAHVSLCLSVSDSSGKDTCPAEPSALSPASGGGDVWQHLPGPKVETPSLFTPQQHRTGPVPRSQGPGHLHSPTSSCCLLPRPCPC